MKSWFSRLVTRCLAATLTKPGMSAILLVFALMSTFELQLHAAPVHLRTDQRLNPTGIDTIEPALSWQSDDTTRNWKQSAYRILVATSPQRLKSGSADVWDSGRVVSSESIGVPYGGPPLKSRQRCYWLVRTWDEYGVEAVSSEPSWWEMGLLQPTDWTARWVRASDAQENAVLERIRWVWLAHGDAHHVPQGLKAEFRYHLHLDAQPANAVLHLMIGGNYTAYVNGVQTGAKEEWGSFDAEDIREHLHIGSGAAGDNLITVQVDVPSSGHADGTFPAALAAAIEVVDAKGRPHWLVSGDGWEGRAKTENAEQAWSPVSTVGPFKSEYFGVNSDRHSPAPIPPRIVSGSSLYRKDFAPRTHVVSARLYITALGSYLAYVNGKPVSEDRLTPGFTDFRKRVLYQTYDVTTLIVPGKNTLAAMLGAGWHGSPLLWSGTRIFLESDMLHAQLELTFADGTRQTIGTDKTWFTAPSAITSSELYAGENYDARMEQPGWNDPGFHGKLMWKPAVEDMPPAALKVTAEPDQPVHMQQTLTPQSITMVGNAGRQDAVFDMGQNMVGVVRLRVRGERGTQVRMRFAERLNPDGSVYTENLRDADATDIYTLSGKGEEEWTPAFTLHGFRYVQVSGYPGKPTLAALQGLVLNSLAGEPAIKLDTSSELLNHMEQLGFWGQRGNFVSVPTDCPQRDERMGWMGDAGVFWRTGSYNFPIDDFSNKFMQDIVDAQNTDGSFSNISPNILMGIEKDPGAPGWGDAGILVPYATWLQYGDLSIVRRNWPAMQRWMDFILKTNPDYIRDKQLGMNYADWLAPDPHTPRDLVATAYWALIAKQMSTLAGALHEDADAQRYDQLFTHIRAAYQQRYIKADGSVKGNTQSAYVLTLYPGLAQPAFEKSMTDQLVKDIQGNGMHLTTGFLGTPFLLSVLDEHGRSDIAYDLLLSKTYPSWGYMVEKGATTWWERWNGDTGDPSMNSYNHYAFGSVMAWVYRRVAGIEADPAAPGFHHILIAPQMDPQLTHAHTEYNSAYGTITTDWTRDKSNGLTLRVTIPANTTATVRLPAGKSDRLIEDERTLPSAREGDSFTTDIGSGTYTFSTH